MTSISFGAFHTALVKGMGEILGETMAAGWITAPVENLSAWLGVTGETLVDTFGQVSAEGIAFRSGRCAFTAFIQAHGVSMGIASLDYRLQPVLQRIQNGLNVICQTISQTSSIDLHPHETGDAYFVQSDLPFLLTPFFLAGFFQEYFEWASNGKTFLYTIETLPGGTWQLRFVKTPFDH